MNVFKHQRLPFVISYLASFTFILRAWGSDDTSSHDFETRLDALLTVSPHSSNDLKPALAFIKSHEKDPDLEGEMEKSRYFVMTEDKIKYYFNPDKFGRNTLLSIDNYYIDVFYDTVNKEVIDEYSSVMAKKLSKILRLGGMKND